MRAMILAAGRGERMRNLTETIPKPLLKVAGHYLIEYSIRALAKIGIQEIVINISYHRDLIKYTLGDGSRYGVSILYSEEETPLETGGGIYQALPLLGDEPFVVLSSDIVTHFPLQKLPTQPEKLAHIMLVDNPSYHLKGDFALQDNQVTLTGTPMFTFSNISVFHPEFFADCKPGRFRLGDLLRTAISRGQVTGEHFQDLWLNLGTPEELAKADDALSASPLLQEEIFLSSYR
jgi:N-acetyl-alpha-D-muramate 1-phosphate uridylyltransferase